MITLNQHPLSAAFPEMGRTEFDALLADLEKHGMRDPITLLDGMVLDGWHRYQCCQHLDVEPRAVEFPSGDDPAAFVISRNIHRRSLSSSQRAIAVAACHEWKPKAGRPSKQSATESPIKTTEQLAKVADVSRATMTDAKAVIKAGRADEVRDGKASVKSIARPTKPKPAPEPEDEPDWKAELAAADKEIRAQAELIASLQKSDLAKEIVTWKGKFDALNGRIRQLMTTEKEFSDLAKYQGDLLGKIRKLLGVEKNAHIIAALEKLK